MGMYAGAEVYEAEVRDYNHARDLLSREDLAAWGEVEEGMEFFDGEPGIAVSHLRSWLLRTGRRCPECLHKHADAVSRTGHLTLGPDGATWLVPHVDE